MKRFLIKLCVTLLGLLAIAWGLDKLITGNLRRSDARMFSTLNAIYSDSLKCDVVIMGSSRGQTQYDTRVIDSITGFDSYNISVDGRCIDAEVVIYNAYRHHAPKPRIIIQNIDWGTLQMSSGYEREQYLPYIMMDDLYEQTLENENFTWFDRWIPLARYAGCHEVIKEGLGLGNKLNRPKMYKGVVPHDEMWDGTAFQQIDSIDFVCNPEAVAIFERYLDCCRSEGVHVVMVYAPFYIEATRKMGEDVQKMFDLYQSFADRYGCDVLNYTFDSISYDTLNFYNASHMNRFGAERFSVKLACDLKALVQ